MLVTPTQFFFFLCILEPQRECECWVLVCIQLSFHGQVKQCCGAQPPRKPSLPLASRQLPGDPGAGCCPTEKGLWLCGSLIATLCLPPGEPCSEMADLLFRNLSAGGEGLCFKVLSVFKGGLFHTGLSSLRFRRQATLRCCRQAWAGD